MNVLFEEDGAFRAGSVLADNVTSLQIELASGKRSKVKAANILLRFAAPAPGELLERAETEAEGIDIDFLWEVCACMRRRSIFTARAAAASARRRPKSCRPRWPAWKRSASRRRPSSAWSTNSSTANCPPSSGPSYRN